MSLRRLTASNFRCLKGIEFDAHPRYNLVHGANASGKTSVLEAIGYLGRGKSFRGAAPQHLIAHGSSEFFLLGKVDSGARVATIGIRNSKAGLEVKIDGDRATSAAALAGLLPLQVLDSDVHGLVAGGPEKRRRYLDWIAFHVEPGYPEQWQRFRRALKQRNAALRAGAAPATVAAWDREFLEAAGKVDEIRRAILNITVESLQEMVGSLLDLGVGFEYRQGWAMGMTLEEALAAGLERDRQAGATTTGPQRAELLVNHDEGQAKRLVSRGQEKLLACAMILAATYVVQTAVERPLLLLLDDPAAELDQQALARLMNGVFMLGCQVVATALEEDILQFPEQPAVFHVEQGSLHRTG